MKKKSKRQDDELDMSHLNETVEETERRRDAEANLTDLHTRGPGSPDFDAPFAPGLGSAGIIPNDEDGDYRDTGSQLRVDLGDGSIDGMSDLNDVSGNPQVYNGAKTADELADISDGGMGGMTIEHINDVPHGTGALPEEVREHEKKRKAERVHFKTDARSVSELPRTGVRTLEPVAQQSSTRPSGKKAASQDVKKKSVKPASKKATAKKATAKKTSLKKSAAKTASKKAAAKKKSAKKSAAGKSAFKKSSSKKSPVKKSATKKSASRKAPAKTQSQRSGASRKKTTAKKSSNKKSSGRR